MAKSVVVVIYLFVMVAVVVAADILFFRHNTGKRLIANIGIVLIFVAFYFIFIRKQ